MKIVFMVFCCIGLLACKQKIELPEINYEQIKYLTLGSLTEEQVRAMAEKKLEEIPYAEYQKLSSDQSQLNARIQMIVDDLQQKEALSSKQFLFHANVSARRFNKNDQTLNLSFPFKFGQLVFRPIRAGSLFPEYIQVLIANIDDLANIPVSELSDFESDFESLKAVYTIEVVEAQHTRYLQAIVKQVEVYNDPNHDDLAYQFTAKEKVVDIVKNRLLSDGYSLNLTPVHSFSFFNKRVLDPFHDLGRHNEVCEKQGQQLNHQVIHCKYDHLSGDNGSVYLDVTVVGGSMAEISLKVEGDLTADQQAMVMRKAMEDLNLKPAFLTAGYSELISNRRVKNVKILNEVLNDGTIQKVLSWEYFGVLIKYNPAAFKPESEGARSLFELKAKAWINYQKKQKG
ncbi:hypothetical protein [Marinicella litoralis]|uniref:Lipoprotein n=1 Tax=Marinicella litoralis TaxID=644220 RepID=A0A4R6XM87_9GAMM|nr:hypothetical protein [Marinicella litoralis]TDR18403.1 hypothetical protein C8D91_2320 [Marinicella litoralis]